MPGPAPIYRPLPGSGYRSGISLWVVVLLLFVICLFALMLLGRRVKLWEGDDHLLMVESSLDREKYKRFNYRDIQAITAYRTIEGRVANAVLAFIMIFTGLLSLTGQDTEYRPIFMVLFAICTIALVVNMILGPTCKCQLRTAVHVEDMVSLGRLRHLRQVLERIGPRIAAVQGAMSPEEISMKMRDLAVGPARTTTPVAASPQQPVQSSEAPPIIVETPDATPGSQT